MLLYMFVCALFVYCCVSVIQSIPMIPAGRCSEIVKLILKVNMDNSGGLFLYCFCSCIILSYCCSLLLSVFALFPHCMLIDSCYLLFTHYPGAPKKTTDKLQRVLNAAAGVVSNSRKYDRGLNQFHRQTLHCWKSPTASSLDCACRYTSACTARLPHTQKSCAGQSLISTVVGTWGQLVEACLTYHESSCRHMEDVHSATPALLLGTLFLTVWRTALFLSLSSETSLNIFFSHRTSTSSAFEVITEMHYINYLLTYLLTNQDNSCITSHRMTTYL